MTDVDKRHIEAAPDDVPAVASAVVRTELRHPLERRVCIGVAILDVVIVVAIVLLLLWGAEWIEARPTIGKYAPYARLLLIAVLGAPVVAAYARRKRRKVALEEGIRLGPRQLPEVHRMLASHCARVGIAEPELYVSDGIDHTASFAWRGHECVILSTHEFATHPDAFEDIVDVALAREVGSICLGHTSNVSELLMSSVAPIPFLRRPLSQVRTLSRDRYGAALTLRALRALLVTAAGDRLLDRVDIERYFAQVDTGVGSGFLAWAERLLRENVPLGVRVRELRRAGMLRSHVVGGRAV